MSLLLLLSDSDTVSSSSSGGQDLLDLMEVLNPELQLQEGEPDVARALLALNAAQDFFESLASQHPTFLGSSSDTVSTTTGSETITFPSGLLRLDRLFLLRSDGTVESEVFPAIRAGGHVQTGTWPWNIINSAGSGKPYIFWTNGRLIYLNPIPSATYDLRWYGFEAQDNITADGSFAYPDMCQLPFATFAVRLIKSGLDDPSQDLVQLARDTFEPVIQSLSNFIRIKAAPLNYTQIHEA